MTIKLPDPKFEGTVSLEKTLLKRRCRRTFSNEPLSMQEVSQLLWAAQGTTSPDGFRTCPSAGALYPLETLIIAGNVQQLESGVYRYHTNNHELSLVREGDVRPDLANASLKQTSIQKGPVSIVFTAIYDRTTWKYGQRGIQYVHMEAGHAAQNVCLQATALGMGTVMIGAFHDNSVKEILNLGNDEEALYILPVGKK